MLEVRIINTPKRQKKCRYFGSSFYWRFMEDKIVFCSWFYMEQR